MLLSSPLLLYYYMIVYYLIISWDVSSFQYELDQTIIPEVCLLAIKPFNVRDFITIISIIIILPRGKNED